ncbi:Serine/threonine-protein kinase PK-1 [Enhygromyxa salina]|uniref:Serine/threonine-protein kinase PK-1 n=1 Tax=Enhygromyxa salina TaxID=215803 RepID=A0A2S9XCY3_9BACT|nr:serine/threonine-protein kinase [Enhygromyxa salina]PRP90716.1 Serine/threonine-protein kinase PK-1 [Enhygromyxa salina]
MTQHLATTSEPETAATRPRAELVARARPGASLEPGMELGRYLVLEELGRGGMGVVVAAYDPQLRRRVAIKVLRRATNREQLDNEAHALAALNHPNVVAIHDVGSHAGGTFIAMEYVEGQTLAEWLRARPRSLAAILAVFTAAARGLQAAHHAGITHRDIKPSNVMVGRDGRVRVTDFGLAHGEALALESVVGSDDMTMTISHPNGVVVGTPAYMAPEQFEAEAVDHRVDQFAICVALWEAVCGTRPFLGDSYVELREVVCLGAPVAAPPTGVLPAWLRRVLERGLARDPAARYPDMLALIEALESDPRPRRRRRVAAAVAAAVIGIGIGASELAEHSARRACVAEAARAEALVELVAADHLRQAFTATGLPFAASSHRRVQARIQAWVTDWSAARTQLCTAIIDGELSEAEAAPRRACLDEQLDRGRSFVELLRAPTAELVGAAVPAVARLPSPTRCAEPQSLLLYDDRRDGSLVAGRPELDRELSRVSSLLVAEQNDAARTAAQALLDQAERAEAAELHRVELVLGAAHIALDEHEAGQAALRRAHYGALAAGADIDALDAAIALVDANAQLHGDYELAARWAETAAALTTRLGLEGSAVDGRRLAVLGNLHYREGDLDEAAQAYTAAHAIVVERLPAGHPQIASSLINLANIAAARALPDEARAGYERAHALLVASYGDDHPSTARPLINLGNLALDGADFKAAVADYERARALLEPLGEDSFELTVVLQNLAAAWYYSRETQRACDTWERVLELRRRQLPVDSPEIAELLANLGTCYKSLGDGEAAIAALEQSLELLETNFGADAPRLAPVLNNLGVFLRGQGDYAQARSIVERALEIHERQGVDSRVLAQTRGVLARTLLDLGDLAAAREQIDRALAFYARDPGPGFGEGSSRCVDLALRVRTGAAAAAQAEAEVLLADPAWAERHESLRKCLVGYGVIGPRAGAADPASP